MCWRFPLPRISFVVREWHTAWNTCGHLVSRCQSQFPVQHGQPQDLVRGDGGRKCTHMVQACVGKVVASANLGVMPQVTPKCFPSRAARYASRKARPRSAMKVLIMPGPRRDKWSANTDCVFFATCSSRQPTCSATRVVFVDRRTYENGPQRHADDAQRTPGVHPTVHVVCAARRDREIPRNPRREPARCAQHHRTVYRRGQVRQRATYVAACHVLRRTNTLRLKGPRDFGRRHVAPILSLLPFYTWLHMRAFC